MKKNPPNVWVRPHCVRKMLQVMKLALLFVVLFFTSASAFTQRVSLSVKAETTLNEVLKQVKDQTGVRILYDAGKMKRVPVSGDEDYRYGDRGGIETDFERYPF